MSQVPSKTSIKSSISSNFLKGARHSLTRSWIQRAGATNKKTCLLEDVFPASLGVALSGRIWWHRLKFLETDTLTSNGILNHDGLYR